MRAKSVMNVEICSKYEACLFAYYPDTNVELTSSMTFADPEGETGGSVPLYFPGYRS